MFSEPASLMKSCRADATFLCSVDVRKCTMPWNSSSTSFCTACKCQKSRFFKDRICVEERLLAPSANLNYDTTVSSFKARNSTVSLKVLCISKDLHMNREMATRPFNINSILHPPIFKYQVVDRVAKYFILETIVEFQEKKNHISQRKPKQGMIS